MDTKLIHTWKPYTNDDWILKIVQLDDDLFVVSTSNGSLVGYSFKNLSATPLFKIEKAHESSVNDIVKIDDSTIASCSTDGVKIWDLKTTEMIANLTNSKKSNFLSLTYKNNFLAGGTELVGVDAELHIWDIRNTDEVVRSFVDSHHDDIMALEFHPTLNNYLMSGSTDGYVNIYDLNQPDEDEALHQVINFASVHSCHFITDSRISILSHMETLMFHDLNDTNYEELVEPKFTDVGDLRSIWDDNEYVVDVRPQGYAIYGANSKKVLRLLPFHPRKESFDTSKTISFPGAHGEEVVRDLVLIPGTKSAISCGEDGNIKLWELPTKVKLRGGQQDEEKEDRDLIMKDTDSKEQSKDKEKKKKSKKDKKKSKKDVRFKPY
ncbi:hypothetical protein SBY92_004239 [Candida maltosa Xu316]|uniref:WD repeat protein, putative n=1 Tax=Candida maltosa (strain Xu316) TaxID=1245528 RepID=M3K125_CANMX|nr:WD repeat protein, putative [Candida maltosa Xu316]